MNQVEVTVVGNVGGEVKFQVNQEGDGYASFTLASTPRYYDRRKEGWTDGDTSWFTVNCWRELAEHVASSLAKGDPVVVTGRLRIRTWDSDAGRGKSVIIDARTVGHDLSRGTSAFQRRSRGRAGQGQQAAGATGTSDTASQPASPDRVEGAA